MSVKVQTYTVPSRRSFFALVGALGISTLADGLLFVVLPLWVYAQTGSPTATSVTFIVQSLPRIFVSPIAGLVSDRQNRRTVLIVSYLLRLLIFSGLFVALFTQVLFAVYVLLFLESVAAVFARPAANALIAQLVPREQLVSANGTLNLVYSLAQILSPVLGTLLLAVVQAPGVVIASVGLLLLATILLTMLSSSAPVSASAGSAWQGLVEGWRTATQNPVTFRVLTSGFALWLGQGVVVATAIPWLKGLPGISENAFGLLIAASGAGMVAGGLITTTIVKAVPPTKLYAASLALGAVMLTLSALQTHLSLLLILFGFFGVFTIIPIVAGQTLIQQATPQEFLGRLFATSQLTGEAARTFGLLLAPLLILWSSSQTALIIAASVTLFGALLFQTLRGVRSP